MGLKMRIKLRPSRQVPPLPLSLLFPQVFLFGDVIRDERRINDETVTIPGNSDGSSEASFRDSSGRAQEYERILTDSVNICHRAKRRLSSKDVSGRNNRKIRGNESFTNKYVEIVLNFLVLTKKNEILLDVQPLSQRKSKRSDEGKFTRVALKSNCKQLRNSGVRDEISSIRSDLGHGEAGSRTIHRATNSLLRSAEWLELPGKLDRW